MPKPKIVTPKKMVPPMLTAPIASAPSRPTMIVSTSHIIVQPTSAAMTGPASRTSGRSSSGSGAGDVTVSAMNGPG